MEERAREGGQMNRGNWLINGVCSAGEAELVLMTNYILRANHVRWRGECGEAEETSAPGRAFPRPAPLM